MKKAEAKAATKSQIIKNRREFLERWLCRTDLTDADIERIDGIAGHILAGLTARARHLPLASGSAARVALLVAAGSFLNDLPYAEFHLKLLHIMVGPLHE